MIGTSDVYSDPDLSGFECARAMIFPANRCQAPMAASASGAEIGGWK